MHDLMNCERSFSDDSMKLVISSYASNLKFSN